MRSLLLGLHAWLDERTGFQQQYEDALYENVPGGSRWIYVTGSMLVLAFVTQVVTGFALWMFYSPGSQNAWESVFWIQTQVPGGWFLRGVHHYMSNAMMVILPLHLLQVVLFKAYVKPREINFWMGLVLMLLVMGLGLTGYLLPWDQKGYWATKVATELMSLPPGGEMIQKLVVGGIEYGHHTLTRFFALHAGLLPTLLVLVLAFHVALFRRHGITVPNPGRRADEYFWPRQVLKDAVACGVMLIVVTGMVLYHHGAALGPPAEPLETFGAARPEWYYLFLFQLLKKFENEFIGAIVVPGVVMLFLFSMPLLANRIRFAHIVNVVMLFVLLGGAAYLTYEAIYHDRLAQQELNPPENVDERALYFERREASLKFIVSQAQAQREFKRAQELVEFFGIPKEGAASGLLKHDPEIQGPRLFASHCASCHSYENPEYENPESSNQEYQENRILGPPAPRDEQGEPLADPLPYGAPNLYGFANRQWFRRILDPADQGIAGDHMFGNTAHRDGEMVTFVQEELTDLSDPQQTLVDDIVAALSAEAKLKGQQQADQVAQQDGTIQRGIAALGEAVDSQSCLDCHCFHNDEGGMAPDLSNYGSLEWLTSFIADPEQERFYGYDSEMNDRMPSFARHPHDHKLNLLTRREIDLIARWLRGDDRDLATSHLRGQLAP